MLPAIYRACQPQMAAIAASARISPTPAVTRGLFAMAVAHRFAAYGASTALRFPTIRTARRLACDSAAALAYYVYVRVGGGTEDFRFLGANLTASVGT